MLQDEFIFGDSKVTQSRGDYYIRISVIHNKANNIGDTLSIVFSEKAVEDFELKKGDRIKIGFNSKGDLALQKVDSGGWKLTGEKKLTVKAITRNFSNLPKYMINEWAKMIEEVETYYFDEAKMIICKTGIIDK